MSSPSFAPPARITGSLWRVLVLMILAVSINYIDRGNLSIAAPLLKDELNITAGQLGLLLSAFFWTYSLFQLVSGLLVDRFNENVVLAVGFFLWSAATAATGFVGGFWLLFTMRLILGVGESVAYPAFSKILAKNFAEHQRGLANSLIDAGTKIGPALGTLFGGLLIAQFGWRPFFIALGIGSLPWLIPWLKWMPGGHKETAKSHEPPPSVWEIMFRRQFLAALTGHFCGNYFWYFLLTWLPFYLVRELKFSMSEMATLGAIAYLISALSTTITGWVSDRLIAAGSTPTKVRRTCTGAGLGFATIVIGVAMTSNRTLSVAILLLSCIPYGVFASSHWAITQTLAGPRAAGRWTGLQNFFGNLSGIVGPAVTGIVVERTGQFFWAFAVCAIVVLIGSSAYIFGMGKVEPIQWRSVKDRAVGDVAERHAIT